MIFDLRDDFRYRKVEGIGIKNNHASKILNDYFLCRSASKKRKIISGF